MERRAPTAAEAEAFDSAVEDAANKPGGNYTIAKASVAEAFGYRFPGVNFDLEPVPAQTSRPTGPEATTN